MSPILYMDIANDVYMEMFSRWRYIHFLPRTWEV